MRINSLKKSGWSLMLAAAFLPLAIPPAAAQQYHITDLGVLLDSSGVPGSYSDAYSINNAGLVVGQTWWDYDFNSEGSVWDAGALFAMGNSVWGYGINNSNQIAGSVYNPSEGASDGIIWQGGGISDFGELYSGQSAGGQGLNDSGQVVGTSANGQYYEAFTYGPTSFFNNTYSMVGLGTLGGSNSYGYGVNNNGVIYGSSDATTYGWPNNIHAFACMLREHYYNGHFTFSYDMCDLVYGYNCQSAAYAANDNDLLVGAFLDVTNTETTYPVEYQFDESTNTGYLVNFLNPPYPDTPYNSAALAVNNENVAVGYFDSSVRNVACLWDGNGAHDLNNYISTNSGWTLWKAEGINDSGQIVGQGYNSSDGNASGFLLTPIGPGSLSLKQSSVTGSLKTSATVSLNYPAVSNMTVYLDSTDGSVALPAVQSVTIPAGSTSASFTIKTFAVTSPTQATITATGNNISTSATLLVEPVGVKALALSPDPVVGGNNVAGTVTLAAPAAPGSITVSLSSNKASVANPTVSSLTIPAGAKTASFTIQTAQVPAITKVTITTAANGTRKSKTLTVEP